MAIFPRVVAVVLDPDFGPRLLELSVRCPVWIRNSERNDPVIQTVWEAAKDHGSGADVTSFRTDERTEPEQQFLNEWRMIEMHRPSLLTLEVYGVPPTEAISAELEEYGFTWPQVMAYGFIATRPGHPAVEYDVAADAPCHRDGCVIDHVQGGGRG
jgi:hypothetical protein